MKTTNNNQSTNQYTIKNTVDNLTATDYTRLSKIYLCYMLDGLELGLTDAFINCIYKCYLESNFENLCTFASEFCNFCEDNEIYAESILTLEDLNEILDEFIYNNL